MRFRFKSMLCFILILIIGCISIGVGYLFYHKADDADIVVDGYITINYLNGKSFKLNGNKEIEFSVTNNNSEQQYYYIQLKDVYAKNVTYELTSSDGLTLNNDLKSDIILNQITINPGDTIKYVMKFVSNSKDNYSGVIQVGVKSNEENIFADVILRNNKVSGAALTSMGESAVLDEGLLSMQDDLGIAYYYRGNIVNNYVSFGGMTWRIVKINGDGSVKLVLNELISQTSKYEDVSDTLNEWFNDYLDSYSDYIAYYKFCADATIEGNGYAAYNRLITNKIPNFVCLGESYNDKIGLLTADEVLLAGGSLNENKEYYLYNENIKTAYYTMTAAKGSGKVFYPFTVDTNGAMVSNVSGDLLRGVRPVINIIKNSKVDGNGTIDNPYTLIMS